MSHLKRILILALISQFAACGQKGALILDDNSQGTKPPVTTEESLESSQQKKETAQ